MSKLIGLIISKHENVMGITLPYFEYLSEFGDIVLINPLTDTINTSLDLLVLPGGADMYPMRYGEKPSRYCGKPNLDLEYFGVNVLPKYIEETEIPILGICRGAQELRVTYGGKLVQHIGQDFSNTRTELVDTLVYTEFGNQCITNGDLTRVAKCNSIHHQGWFDNTPHFEVIAYNKEFMNVEIMLNYERNILAVQYHPEETYCELVSNWIITQLA